MSAVEPAANKAAQAADPNEIPAGMLLPPRQKALVMVGVMLSLFLAALDFTIMGVAMPRVVADFGRLDLFAWPITAYMLASTVIVPVAGKLSDVYGRRPLLLIGVLVFLLGSVLAGASTSMFQLIGFRAVQGVGGGLIMANAFTAIGDLFAPQDRGRWTGIISGTFAIASVVGPLLGGTLTDHLSWRWVFFTNIPFGLLALAVVYFWMPSSRRGRAEAVDYRGAIALMLAAGTLLLGISWAGNQYPWTDVHVILPLTLAAVFGVTFLVVERGAVNAVLPLGLFRNRVFAVSVGVGAIVGVGMFGAIQFLPLFVQGAQGASATASGTVTMPMMGGVVIGSITTGQLLSHYGRYRLLALIGGAVMVVGAGALSTLEADSSKSLTRGYMALLGLGIGTAMPLYNLAVQNTLPYSQLGVGTASLQFSRQLGGTIGVAVFGSLLASGFARELSKAFPVGFEDLKERPQILLEPESLAAFRESVEVDAPGTAAGVIETARAALAFSITDLFFIAAAAMLIGLGVAFFLPRIRARRREELLAETPDEGAEESPAGPADSGQQEPPAAAAPAAPPSGGGGSG